MKTGVVYSLSYLGPHVRVISLATLFNLEKFLICFAKNLVHLLASIWFVYSEKLKFSYIILKVCPVQY